MIKLFKPKFWDKKKISFIGIILYPLTLITSLYIFLKRKFTRPKIFNISVICVGNIYIGGTGKTPISIYLAKELFNLGAKPVILRKYYKNHTDEYKQIKNNFKELIVEKNRVRGIEIAEKRGYDVVILDDGLQDYKIKKKFKILCFHQGQQIGNGFLIPSGPLRENLNVLRDIDVVFINGSKDIIFEKKLFEINQNLDIYYTNYVVENINKFKNKKLLAIAGIANPENFFRLLEENNLSVEDKLVFPDHYKFSKQEIQNIMFMAKEKKLELIMTEKDFYKINEFNIKNLNYLKVNLKIHNKEKLIAKIRKIYE